MNFKQLEAWVEANPGKSVLIGGGVVIFLLWLFGAFSKSAPSDSGQSSLAAAYYAAEAQQAVVGGQIQQANIAANASTAQTLISANAATAINQQNTGAAVTINGQNVNTAQMIAGLESNVLMHNADVSLAGLQSNNATAERINQANVYGAEAVQALKTVVPSELVLSGGFGNFFLPGGQNFSVNTGAGIGSPDFLKSIGFSDEESKLIASSQQGYPQFAMFK